MDSLFLHKQVSTPVYLTNAESNGRPWHGICSGSMPVGRVLWPHYINGTFWLFCPHNFPHAVTEVRACGTEFPAIVGKARYAFAQLANHKTVSPLSDHTRTVPTTTRLLGLILKVNVCGTCTYHCLCYTSCGALDGVYEKSICSSLRFTKTR